MSVTEWVLTRECEIPRPHCTCEVYTLQSDVTGLLNHLMGCTTPHQCKYHPTQGDDTIQRQTPQKYSYLAN